MYSGNMCLQIAHVRFFQFYKFWVLDRVDGNPKKYFETPKNFNLSLFSSLLAVIASKCHFWPKEIICSAALLFLAKTGQKWHFKAITAKSEENGLKVKIQFYIFLGVSKYFFGFLSNLSRTQNF